MSHGINTKRDYVKGLKGQGKDWHGLTDDSFDKLTRELFPELFPGKVSVEYNGKPLDTGLVMLVSSFDQKPIGIAHNPETFKIVHPRQGFDTVISALEGTGYTVERLGMLWDGSVWFVSIDLAELRKVSRKGEKFQLNFHGGLDGSTAFEGELSNIRIVCNNTLNLSRATGQKLFRVKQTRFSENKVKAVAAEIETAVGMAKIFNETLATLEKTPATKDEARLAYAGILKVQGAKFERTELKRTVDAGNGLFRKEGTGEYRENRAVNLIDGALLPAFERGDGNAGKTRADVLNGFTQVFTRGTDDSDKDPLKALMSDVSDAPGSNATRKAEFYAMLARPETRDGKKVTKPDGWTELVTIGRKALETAHAL